MFEVNDASVGIIGGADGPTAIFVAGPDPLWYVGVGIVAVAVAVGIVILVKKRKNRDKKD
ncbi:MAG: sodium ion-translocating decarboxylase subunit beta [Ruminococcaceae bacterium]|nr:sodium ion-translocating decarboxylase subunit beta [Oscillospiraceae bacterium]